MNKERKAILGQWHNGRLYISDDEKRRIIEDYLSGKGLADTPTRGSFASKSSFMSL